MNHHIPSTTDTVRGETAVQAAILAGLYVVAIFLAVSFSPAMGIAPLDHSPPARTAALR
ncbi:MAG: hypothetical protein ACM31L_18180 [Actinomycetota bacterium]